MRLCLYLRGVNLFYLVWPGLAGLWVKFVDLVDLIDSIESELTGL